MKKIIFLAGLPGVGKSTLARKIANMVGGMVLDIDRIKREIVDPNLVTTTIDPPEVRWKCYEKAAKEIFDLLERETSTIIVDEVFHLQFLRQKLENLCKEKADVLWIEVRCSHKEVEKRFQICSRNGHILSTEETLRMHLLFQKMFDEFPAGKVNYRVFKNEGNCDIKSLVL